MLGVKGNESVNQQTNGGVINFSTAERVQSVISQGDQIARIQSDNRRKINDLFNGFPSLTAEEAKRSGVRINCNWGEAAVIAQHAKRQYKSAFLGTKNFFRVTLPNAPVEKQEGWEIFITRKINGLMKQSAKYEHVHNYKWTSVPIHGMGPTIWYDDQKWCPDYVALPDLRIATDSTTDFENLNWFATRQPYSVYDLAKKVWGEYADKHWQKKPIAKMLAEKKDINYSNAQSYDWLTNPEKMAELVKQNGTYYHSDAVPVMPLWHFYYLDDSKLRDKQWKMTVIPDWQSGITASEPFQFLYENDKPIASDLSRLFHCQFGDLNVDMPAKVHSVRSLGFQLMEPCFYTNLTRCRYLQHVHESFNVWLRVTDPAGKARAQKIELYDRAVIPEGVSIVPQDQRHQVQPALVAGVMQELRQLMAEASVSYTQDVNEPGSEEETATKTMAKIQQVNALLGGLLADAFRQEIPSYREICRRFCIRKSIDPDVRKFQKACDDFGIPKQYINLDQWEIEPEIPLGNGNPTMAMAQADKLMAVRTMLAPSAQQEALHEYIEVVTDNPRKADRWAPIDQAQGITDAVERAEAIFGTLMQGVPARLKEGLNPIEIIETLMGMMAGVIARIEQTGNMATQGEVAGLKTVYAYLNGDPKTGQPGLIPQLAQNEQEKQRVKQYGDQLGQLMNVVKGFAQRLQEQQGDPESAAKIQAIMQTTQAKLQAKQATDQQKMAHKEQSFKAEQQRKNLQITADQQRQSFATGAEIGREHAKARAEVQREHAKAGAEVQREQVKTEAEIERQKEMADAAPAKTEE